MPGEAHLIIEAGPCKGREITIPPGGGARAGRSSGNDIALADPSVSRFHCRIFFKPGQGLWVADLGSANQTLVNGKGMHEQRLGVRDRISIGDTVIKVVSDGGDEMPAAEKASAQAPAPGPAPVPGQAPASAPGQRPPAGIVDLGLSAGETRAKSRLPNRRVTLLLVLLVAMTGLAAWIVLGGGGAVVAGWLGMKPAEQKNVAPPQAQPDLELRYERVEATATNIFQYVMTIAGRKAGLELHDLANGRHFIGAPVTLDEKVIAGLAGAVEEAGFFSLQNVPPGTGQGGGYVLSDLDITIGRKTRRMKVLNAAEPHGFQSIRAAVEEFGLNEFGIRALAYPRDELIKLAHEAMLFGTKLYDEKTLRDDNLYKAIRSFREARIYLETVDPKPDFYRETVDMQNKCDKELRDICKELWFQADRATKLRDWQEAARVLQAICATVPDRAEKDHQQAQQRLLDVQSRIPRK